MNFNTLVNKTQSVIDFIKTDKTLGKNIYPHTWLSGDDTTVFPIIAYRDMVKVQLNDKHTTEYRLRGFAKRIKNAFPDLITDIIVSSYDGSCPRHVSVYFAESFTNEWRKTNLAFLRDFPIAA